MKILTAEEFAQTYDGLPESLKAAINSDTIDITLNAILKRNRLVDSKAVEVRRITAAVFLGLVHPEEIASEIVDRAHVDLRFAKEISNEIETKILSRIADDLNKAHGFHIPLPTTAPGATAPQPAELAKPQFEPEEVDAQEVSQVPAPAQPLTAPETPVQPNEAPPSAPTPFVLHERPNAQQVQPSEQIYEGGLVRPSFFRPNSGALPREEDVPTARLEIGGEGQEDVPQTAKVGKEEARVVHYSAPETQVDPFAAAPPQPPEEKPIEKKDEKNIPPENVIDLKDLPK
ncbi:MAG: hypothetical protein Q8P99_01905 [bacterium]|nr:hypothetical protein [bacterium]